MRTALTLAVFAAIAAAFPLIAGMPTLPNRHEPPRPSPTATPTLPPTPRRPARTPAPPRLDPAAINQQDRVSSAHRVREGRVFDSRRLLARLPLIRSGVRIDIVGLAADDHSTVLTIDPGGRSRAHARAVYRHALHDAHDPGDGYVLEWAR